jgi:NADH-dependent peroxiredoxin subunit F
MTGPTRQGGIVTRKIIDEKAKKQLLAAFKTLKQPVSLILFTQKHACRPCGEQEDILREVKALSDKITLEVKDLVDDAPLARAYRVDKVPGTVVLGKKDYGIRFYGITAGYEFTSLIEAIAMVSRETSGLSPEAEPLLKIIDVPVHLEIMVTLTCPYCPQMVHVAHQLAMANDNIRADMVESSEFPQLVQRYRVSGVPRTVINEAPAFEGALPPLDAILGILKVVKPDVYNRIDEEMRKEAGERQVAEVGEDRLYDILIVGAGPAAMSAAIYGIRKGLDIAMIGDHMGGQITDTASIENWLGIPSISGEDITVQFRNHAERYALAELLNVKVLAVAQQPYGFAVKTSNDRFFRSRSVVYCAGKKYRRLGVPGEQRFQGRGIAFCATCDAPLYADKRVAVVGGGNSAFTAARDLLYYAREIHIVNILATFQADPVLMKAVSAAKQVRLHPATYVKEFLGDETLTGIRLESKDGMLADLPIDGAFLEIGLEPNTAPVKDLLPLNEQREIPVNKDQSTVVPGFFAAGDVTDEPEKQIVVAAGAGAKAALAAARYVEDLKAAAMPVSS